MPSDSVSHPHRPERVASNRISTVVLAYAGFAAAWILFSDKAVEWLFSSPAEYTLASILKGWLFVAVTSLLLSLLLRRLSGPAADTERVTRGSLQVRIPIALVMVGIVVLTAVGIAHTVSHERDAYVARLKAIAEFKAQLISDWLRERRADAEFVQTSVYYAQQYHRWQDEGDAASGTQLQTRLQHFTRIRGFHAVLVLDPEGRRLWGTDGASREPAPALHAAAESAGRDGHVRRVGPYIGRDGDVRLDFVAPLGALKGRVPVVVLQSDPTDWLYAMLQTWPVPSTSGETLLLRRDGEDVLFLNELRHRRDVALKLRLPLADQELLAAKMLLGAAHLGEVVEGRDYRDVRALGAARAIPDTDWFLMAKADVAEVYDEAVSHSVWIGLTGLLALFMAGAGFVILRQRERLAITASIQQSEAERLSALRLLGAIADSSDDAIYAKDLQGRYILFNRAASRYAGKPAEEVLGRDDRAIFPAAQAEGLMAVERRIVAEGRLLSEEEGWDTVVGRRILLATKGPLHDADGEVIGTFGISRDITERKDAELALRESEARYRALVEQSLAGIYIIQDNRFRYVNPGFVAIFGYDSPEELIERVPVSDLVDPQDRARVAERMRMRIEGGVTAVRYTFAGRRRDGSRVELEVHGRACDYQGRPALIGLILDITARKAAEVALLQQTEELRTRNEELERFNRATVGRELDMIALKQEVNELSRLLGRQPPYSLAFLDHPVQPTV